MPKIPIIQAETKLPVMNPVEPIGLQVQARTGLAIQGLINTIAEEEGKVNKQKRRIQLERDVDLAKMDVETANVDLVEKLKKDPNIISNPGIYYDEWQKGFNEIVKNRLDQIRPLSFRDKNTKEMVELAIRRNVQTREIIEQKNYGNLLWASDHLATTDKLLNAYLEEGNLEAGIKLIKEDTANGFFTPERGAEKEIVFKKAVEKKIEQKKVKNALNEIMVDPEKTNEIIKKYDIPLEDQADLRKQGEIEADRKFRHEQREIEIAQKVTSDLFFKKLSEPETYGALSIPEINTSNLDINEKNFFRQGLINSVKPKSVKTDFFLAISLLDDILGGNTKGVRETILAEGGKDPNSDDPPRLTTSEAQELLRAYYGKKKDDEQRTKEHYTSDPWFSLTKSWFRDQLGISTEDALENVVERAIKGGVKPPTKNYEYYYKATSELMRRVEKKGLKGEAIYTEGQGILKNTLAEALGKPKEPEPISKMPITPPPGNKEGRYEVNGIEWKWTKNRGWYQ